MGQSKNSVLSLDFDLPLPFKQIKGVGIPLRPTELLIFGNPKIGSHMFTSNQTTGIDLPLKALVYEDEKGNAFLML